LGHGFEKLWQRRNTPCMYCFHQKLLSYEIRNFAAHSSREKRTIAAPRGMRLGTKSSWARLRISYDILRTQGRAQVCARRLQKPQNAAPTPARRRRCFRSGQLPAVINAGFDDVIPVLDRGDHVDRRRRHATSTGSAGTHREIQSTASKLLEVILELR